MFSNGKSGTWYTGVEFKIKTIFEIQLLELNSKCKAGSWVRGEIRSNETRKLMGGGGSAQRMRLWGNSGGSCFWREPYLYSAKSGSVSGAAPRKSGSVKVSLGQCVDWEMLHIELKCLGIWEVGKQRYRYICIKTQISILSRESHFRQRNWSSTLSLSLLMWKGMIGWHAKGACIVAWLPAAVKAIAALPKEMACSFWTQMHRDLQQQCLVTSLKPRNTTLNSIP